MDLINKEIEARAKIVEKVKMNEEDIQNDFTYDHIMD